MYRNSCLILFRQGYAFLSLQLFVLQLWAPVAQLSWRFVSFLQDLVFYIRILHGAKSMWQPTVSSRAPSLHLICNQQILCKLNCDFRSPGSFICSVSSVPASTTKWSRLVSFCGTCCWLWCHWNKFLFKESILSIKCNLCCLYMIGCVVSH